MSKSYLCFRGCPLALNYNHRALCMVGAVVAYASQKHPLNRAKSMRPHHKQIGMQILNHFTNLLLRIPNHHLSFDIHLLLGANLQSMIDDGVSDSLLVGLDRCSKRRYLQVTGSTEGDGPRIEASGDGGWGLHVEDDERAGRFGGGSELEVVEGPCQGVHALLAAIDGHNHAS